MTTCPACGSADLAKVKLAYGADFRPDVDGNVPTKGDTIVVCGHCHAFTIAKPKPAPKPKAKTKRKRSTKPKAKAAAKAA